MAEQRKSGLRGERGRVGHEGAGWTGESPGLIDSLSRSLSGNPLCFVPTPTWEPARGERKDADRLDLRVNLPLE